MLQSQLMRLEGVTSTFETHFFSILMYKNILKRKFWRKNKEVNSVLKDLGSNEVVSWWDSFTPNGRRGMISKVNRAIELYCETKNADVFVEKTPMHLHFIGCIKKEMPTTSFIHILRPRYETVRSLHSASNKYSWSGRRSLAQCVHRWEKDILIHAKFFGCLGHEFILYEKLVNDTDRIIEGIGSSFGCNGLSSFSDASLIVRGDEAWKNNNFSAVGTVTEYDEFMCESEFNAEFPISRDVLAACSAFWGESD